MLAPRRWPLVDWTQRACRPDFTISAAEVSADLSGMLGPHEAFMIKGWSRGMAALTVLLCAYNVPEFLQARVDFKFACLTRLLSGPPA